MELSELTKKIDYITDNIYSYNINVYEEITNIIPGINKQYTDFISLIPALNEAGMNISMEGVLGQLRGLLDAINEKNIISIYDTLKFEIKDTLSYYDEILKMITEG